MDYKNLPTALCVISICQQIAFIFANLKMGLVSNFLKKTPTLPEYVTCHLKNCLNVNKISPPISLIFFQPSQKTRLPGGHSHLQHTIHSGSIKMFLCIVFPWKNQTLCVFWMVRSKLMSLSYISIFRNTTIE